METSSTRYKSVPMHTQKIGKEMQPKVRYSRKTLYYVPLNSCEKQQVALSFKFV